MNVKLLVLAILLAATTASAGPRGFIGLYEVRPGTPPCKEAAWRVVREFPGTEKMRQKLVDEYAGIHCKNAVKARGKRDGLIVFEEWMRGYFEGVFDRCRNGGC